MDLTTTKRVKVLLDERDNAAINEHLSILIDSVSARVERKLGRHVQAKQRTEYFGVPFGARRIFLRGYPVTEILRVWNDPAREFGIDDDTVSTTVSGDSAADQADLTVADSSDFAADDVIAVDQGGDKDEELTISSVPDGTTITCTTNLAYAHSASDADPVIVSPTADCVDEDTYDVLDASGKDIGILWFDFLLSSGANALKVTYTGGLAADTDTFMSNYEDLANAVAAQVAYEWMIRAEKGFSDMLGQNSSARKQASSPEWLRNYGDMIGDLVEAIESYKRVGF